MWADRRSAAPSSTILAVRSATLPQVMPVQELQNVEPEKLPRVRLSTVKCGDLNFLAAGLDTAILQDARRSAGSFANRPNAIKLCVLPPPIACLSRKTP